MRPGARSQRHSFQPAIALRPPLRHRRRFEAGRADEFARTILERYRRRGSWTRLAELVLLPRDLQPGAGVPPDFSGLRLLLSILSHLSPRLSSPGVVRRLPRRLSRTPDRGATPPKSAAAVPLALRRIVTQIADPGVRAAMT